MFTIRTWVTWSVLLGSTSISLASDATDFPRRVWVLRSIGTLFDERGVIDTCGVSEGFPCIGDVDGNGIADLIVSSPVSTGELYLSDRTGAFLGQKTFAQLVSGYPILVGDINNDGKADIVTLTDTLSREGRKVHKLAHTRSYISTSSGLRLPIEQTLTSRIVPSQKWMLGDVNGDGRADLVGLNSTPKKRDFTSLSTFLSQGNGFADPNPSQELPAVFHDNEQWMLGDVNGDGKSDLILVYGYGPKKEATATVWIFLSKGTEFEPEPITQRLSEASFNMKQRWLSADVNGDGKSDLILVYGYGPKKEATATVWIYLSKGSQFSEEHFGQRLKGGFWETQTWATGDVDGDHRADLVCIYKGPIEPPSPPTSLTLTAQNGTSANLSWAHDSARVDGFEISCRGQHSVVPKAYTHDNRTAETAASQRSYTLTQLSQEFTYQVMVRGFNRSGPGPWSNKVQLVVPKQPGPPKGPAAPPPPAIRAYYFKVRSPLGIDVHTVKVYATDEETARRNAVPPNSNYEIISITEKEYSTPGASLHWP